MNRMKVDWSNLNKMFFVQWYIVVILIGIILSLRYSSWYCIIGVHIGYGIYASMHVIEYMYENKIKEGYKKG